jgi:4'-phosphopantetheinyl transferase
VRPTLWLGLEEVPPDLDRPAVWLARDDDPAWAALVASVRASALDLADAALFSSSERAAGRLRRRLLLKALAGRTLGVDAEAVVVERSAAGAIAVTAPQRLCSSLSARAGWTMAGLSRTPIGVDVEDARPAEPLPLDVLSREEVEAMAALPAEARPETFARYWTVKEATLKAMGTGLNRDPAELTVRFDGDLAEVFVAGGPIVHAAVQRTGLALAAVATLKTLPPEWGEVA